MGGVEITIKITKKRPQKNFIGDADSFFNLHLKASDFDDSDLAVMQRVDNAKLLDRNTGLIETPFGLTSIRNLSTGCKTVFVYNYLHRQGVCMVLNGHESGANALKELFALMAEYNDSDTVVYLRHNNKLYIIPEYDFEVDGKTALLSMLRAYLNLGRSSGVSVSTNTSSFRVLEGRSDWESELTKFQNTVYFVDEDVRYVLTKQFADLLFQTGSYLVYITRSGRVKSIFGNSVDKYEIRGT